MLLSSYSLKPHARTLQDNASARSSNGDANRGVIPPVNDDGYSHSSRLILAAKIQTRRN